MIIPLPSVAKYTALFLVVMIPTVAMHVIGIGGQYMALVGGTPIGDMTDNGGLDAAFDGNISQPLAASAARNSALTAYIGRDWGASTTAVVDGFRAWGARDSGFNAFGSEAITLTLQGSNDNYSTIVDLASVTFSDPNDASEQRKLDGIDGARAFRYHRLRISKAGNPNHMYIGEVVFHGRLR